MTTQLTAWNGIDSSFLARLPRHSVDGVATRNPGPREAGKANPGHEYPAAAAPVTTELVTVMQRRRDGHRRRATCAVVDPQNRVSVGKASKPFGWIAETPLTIEMDGQSAVVRPGNPSQRDPWLISVRLDDAGRLALPPAIRAGLALDRGDDVLVVSLIDDEELYLYSGADVAQALTQRALQAVEPPPPEPTRSKPLKGTRIRRAQY